MNNFISVALVSFIGSCVTIFIYNFAWLIGMDFSGSKFAATGIMGAMMMTGYLIYFEWKDRGGEPQYPTIWFGILGTALALVIIFGH